MNSLLNAEFLRLYRRLPAEVREQARRSYRLWQDNPSHPGLRFKKIEGDVYSVRVGLYYRALGTLDGDTVTWFWIGSHAEYDEIIS